MADSIEPNPADSTADSPPAHKQGQQPSELEIVGRSYDHERKCPMCSWRSTFHYNLGEDEDEELAVCASCFVEWIRTTDRYGIFDKTPETPDDTAE